MWHRLGKSLEHLRAEDREAMVQQETIKKQGQVYLINSPTSTKHSPRYAGYCRKSSVTCEAMSVPCEGETMDLWRG